MGLKSKGVLNGFLDRGARFEGTLSFDDTFRITFTAVQSLIVVIAIGLIMLGAFGMATYSSIIAHDWSCRVGLVEKYCPSMPQPKPLPQPEIPV